LEHFLRGNGLEPATVAEWAVISERHLQRLRGGLAIPSMYTLRHIVTACSHLLGRHVRITEVFDFYDENE